MENVEGLLIVKTTPKIRMRLMLIVAEANVPNVLYSRTVKTTLTAKATSAQLANAKMLPLLDVLTKSRMEMKPMLIVVEFNAPDAQLRKHVE